MFKNYYESHLIGSFCGNSHNNIPMWAHYANNHKGFCLRHSVEDSYFVYPVIYLDKKIDIDDEILQYAEKLLGSELAFQKEKNVIYELAASFEDSDILKELSDFFKVVQFKGRELDVFNVNGFFLENLLTNYALLKYSMWSYEDEFRVVHFNPKTQLINNNDIGLKADCIFMGLNCSKDNKDVLFDISKQNDLMCFEMSINNDTDIFRLDETPYKLQ